MNPRSFLRFFLTAIVAVRFLLLEGMAASPPEIKGLTGKITDVRALKASSKETTPFPPPIDSRDVDLKQMAEWAMNYLIQTPRPALGFEPVFQCHPLRLPPVPAGQDPVVACDTDARMDWEWYYMREISESKRGREVEEAFHERIRKYIDDQGRVWSHPGAFNEGNTSARYEKKDQVIHIWGATKILQSLSEDFIRTHRPESKKLARKVMLALKKLAVWDEKGQAWFTCGMGALKEDGSAVPNGWNSQPAPLVEPLLTYWRATGDPEGLAFAKSFAEGIINNAQPGGLHFEPNGRFGAPGKTYPTAAWGISDGHSHATMHAIWGIADLGVVTGEQRYVNFAKGAWDFLASRGTGTGWLPAGPDNCNETCCISDMISIACLIGRAGHAEYFDYAERFFRNYISNLQFIVTPEFENYYRSLHSTSNEKEIAAALTELKKFQGGIIGGSGLNDFENQLLGGVSGFEMFGCCAPEGMRAIYACWEDVIQKEKGRAGKPTGVYVNLSFNRESPWGQVISSFPESGRLSVKAKVKDSFFLRPPHWAPRDQVRAFVDGGAIPVVWSGDYVQFKVTSGREISIIYPLIEFSQEVSGLWSSAPALKMKFNWRGNMVVSSDPAPKGTPLFLGHPRSLP